ncbi:MAG TPA: UdgX family uracil-DNA binding protein [Terriglobales bacterium]|nr:UdgX family uracil-DNA binding protein [Terriglobales bacterium]
MLGKNKQQTDAGPLIPSQPTLQNLKQAASRCKACDLWRKGTQTVFGEGSPRAAMMLIGEQPGDKEDIAGHPFVGPAGRILDEALQAAAIDRSVVYVTNVVKHFNWVPAERGKRRIHKKPRHFEIEACRPWLDAEIALTRPQVIVCLGATAAQALLGRNFSVMKQRAQFVPSPLARWVMATVHPSSILRAPDAAARERQKQDFIADLRVAARQMKNLQKAA